MAIQIKHFFDPDTATFTYVVADPATRDAAIIDPVLGYDQYAGKVNTKAADDLMAYLQDNGLLIQWILETHVHADHLTAAYHLKEYMGGKIGIGSKVKEVLAHWVPMFNTYGDTPLDGSQFNRLFADNAVIKLGSVDVKILHTPGHTPACVSYLIEDAVFVGDTLFMPDLGTARADFPGGSAEEQYDSIQRILSLPDTTRIFLCHDYPPEGREVSCLSSVKEQKEKNILINERMTKAEYVAMRKQRDKGKAVPKLLLPALQVNLRAGDLGTPERNLVCYIKIPLNRI